MRCHDATTYCYMINTREKRFFLLIFSCLLFTLQLHLITLNYLNNLLRLLLHFITIKIATYAYEWYAKNNINYYLTNEYVYNFTLKLSPILSHPRFITIIIFYFILK